MKKYPAVFIIGIGWPLKDGYPHEMRAADYDDWTTEVTLPDGRVMHGLNGDILVCNPVTRRRHELMSGGIRVDGPALRTQLGMSGQLDFLRFPYHQGIASGSSRSASAAGSASRGPRCSCCARPTSGRSALRSGPRS